MKDVATLIKQDRLLELTRTLVEIPSVTGHEQTLADWVFDYFSSLRMDEVKRLVTETDLALEIVHCGNPKVAVEAANLCVEQNALDRIIIGNDAPSGTGVVPLGVLRVICHLASLTAIKPEEAVCMATGNTARVHKLPQGVIAEGKDADLVIMDTPMGSVGENALSAIEAGDVPAVAMVLVDGEIVVAKSRNTPPPVRKPKVL